MATANHRVDLNKLALRLGAIALIMVVSALVVWGLAKAGVIEVSTTAIASACAVCIAGALPGHILSHFPSGNEFIMRRLLVSMMVRAGIPLAAAILAKLFYDSQFIPGFVYLVVLFYLVGLTSETALSLMHLNHRRRPE